MKAIVKTKSNFKNLNGKLLDVYEIVGNRVTCMLVTEYGICQIDFHIKEIVELYTNK